MGIWCVGPEAERTEAVSSATTTTFATGAAAFSDVAVVMGSHTHSHNPSVTTTFKPMDGKPIRQV